MCLSTQELLKASGLPVGVIRAKPSGPLAADLMAVVARMSEELDRLEPSGLETPLARDPLRRALHLIH